MSDYKEDLAKEQHAIDLFRSLIQENQEDLLPIAHWGDGSGGYMLSVIQEVMGLDSGHAPERDQYRKKVISQALRTKVFERDKYRCVSCGTHIDLCADHIIPESKGGETSESNLQTLCRPCNSKKGVK